MLHKGEVEHSSETALIVGSVAARQRRDCPLRQLPHHSEDNKANRRHQWNRHHIWEIPRNQGAFHRGYYPNFKVTGLTPIAALRSPAMIFGFGAGRKTNVWF